MSNDPSKSEKVTKLRIFDKIGYGVGHVLNDLCATIWFSYTLLYLKDVASFPIAAGPLLMLGQLADAFFTAIIGCLTDLYSTKRNWHLIGSAMVALSFPLIFILHRELLPYWACMFYLAFMIVLFQCGWATVQISHLAILPELASNEKERSELNAIRYSISVISNITVFIVAYIFIQSDDVSMLHAEIGPKDYSKFKNIALLTTGFGLLASAVFYISLKSPHYKDRLKQIKAKSAIAASIEDANMTREKTKNRMISVLKTLELYKVAFLYTFSRLFLVICTIYIPIWLNELMKLKTGQTVENIAIIPLVFFASSFITAILLKLVSSLNTSIIYSFGSIISIFGCAVMAFSLFSIKTELTIIELYVIAILFGAGSSITQISSLCITSNFIGSDSETSGLVYSITTACDKIFSGFIILIIELVGKSYRYYVVVLALNGIAPILGLLILASLKRK